MTLAGLCRMYGISLTEARGLQLWEIDVLVTEANRATADAAR